MTKVRDIVIESGRTVVRGRLETTPTAQAIWEALPLEGEAGRWGDEVFLYVDVEAARERDARQVVRPGELCFWCEGGAVAIAFGPTPISLGDECRLVAPVNVWGRLLDDPARLAAVEAGTPIVLRRDGA